MKWRLFITQNSVEFWSKIIYFQFRLMNWLLYYSIELCENEVKTKERDSLSKQNLFEQLCLLILLN